MSFPNRMSEVTEAQMKVVLQAASSTLNHHSSIIKMFGYGFVNTFAFFNAGLISAGLVLLPTELGKEVVKEHPTLIGILFIMWGISFLSACGLKILIFFYCLKKYENYRSLLRSYLDSTGDFLWPSGRDVSAPPALGPVGYILLFCMVVLTIFSLVALFWALV